VQLRAPQISAGEPSLDAQQCAAYAHLAGTRDLAIVTGIAGAGKSRLQRDVAAAYREAGFRVIAEGQREAPEDQQGRIGWPVSIA